jgi:hypothetical protein
MAPPPFDTRPNMTEIEAKPVLYSEGFRLRFGLRYTSGGERSLTKHSGFVGLDEELLAAWMSLASGPRRVGSTSREVRIRIGKELPR